MTISSRTVSPPMLYNRKKNKFVDSITFVGPYAPKAESRQPQEDPDLRSQYRAPPASRRSSPTSRTTPTAAPSPS